MPTDRTDAKISERAVHGTPRTARNAVYEYLNRGWQPVPLRRGTKRPINRDWQTLNFTRHDIDQRFADGDNVGVQLGPRSGGLTDVDLDTPEARSLASFFLPETGAVFGRRSTPAAHRLYRTELADTEQRAVVRFQEPGSLGSRTLLEVRVGGGEKGAQTMVPPSRHPGGELVRWEREGSPAHVSGGELIHQATKLATATLLARHYPAEGSRHEAALVLGGLLARAGASPDEIAIFVEHVARAAGDEEAGERGASASGAAGLLRNGGNTPGLPRMREVWGVAVADKVAKWLEIPTELSVGVNGGDATQVETLLALTTNAVLFHTEEKIAFADIEVDDHVEIWPIRSTTFRQWLQLRYYKTMRGAPNREAMTTAINTLDARALFEGQCHRVFTRTASRKGSFYIDLCDEKWRAVEIDQRGWRILDTPPVRLVRGRGMLPLPTPVRGGSVRDLRRFINIKSDQDFVLLVAWMLAALRDHGPYPILVVRGEEGTGKSTLYLVSCLRALVDPNKVPLRTLPRDERDLYIAAANGYVLAFDNVSTLPQWLSDALCRLSTGGGFATRQLYTDQDELLITASRAAVLNGIEDFVARSDLADRCIFLSTTAIANRNRGDEEELKAGFETKRSAIFGALLNAIVYGLLHLPTVRLESLPRMADFAKWATACEGQMFEEGTFARAYQHNRAKAVLDVIAGDVVADAVMSFMRRNDEWEGRFSALLNQLEAVAGDKVARSKGWPETPRALRSLLQRAQAPLRKLGIVMTFNRARHSVSLVNGAAITDARQGGKQCVRRGGRAKTELTQSVPDTS